MSSLYSYFFILLSPTVHQFCNLSHSFPLFLEELAVCMSKEVFSHCCFIYFVVFCCSLLFCVDVFLNYSEDPFSRQVQYSNFKWVSHHRILTNWNNICIGKTVGWLYLSKGTSGLMFNHYLITKQEKLFIFFQTKSPLFKWLRASKYWTKKSPIFNLFQYYGVQSKDPYCILYSHQKYTFIYAQ